MEDSEQQSSESGAFISSNDDLLTEILLRLPAVSIFRFKSVSKHWLWLLSHRNFTLRYDTFLKSPGLFVVNEYVPFDVEKRNPLDCSRDFYPDRYGIIILQSCNGLLLCRSFYLKSCDLKYYVFNPATKQVAIIPSVTGGPHDHNTIVSMSLACHQTHCVHYKVVCVRKVEADEELFQIHIYSSDSGEWKISIESFSARRLNLEKGVFWNGAIHWHPHRWDHMCFKVEAEQLQVFPLPVQVAASSEGCYFKELPTYFGESRGHLHLATRPPSLKDLRLKVYELSSDHSGWFVKYQIDLDELSDVFPAEMRPRPDEMSTRYVASFFPHAFDVVRGEKEEDTFIVVKIPDKIIRYNVHDKTFKSIYTFTYEMFGILQGHRYTERLSSF